MQLLQGPVDAGGLIDCELAVLALPARINSNSAAKSSSASDVSLKASLRGYPSASSGSHKSVAVWQHGVTARAHVPGRAGGERRPGARRPQSCRWVSKCALKQR
jgi:hypothetical protein